MDGEKVHQALLWQALENQKVKCELCSHSCLLAEGKKGVCGVRQNIGGNLVSLNYGKLIAANLDPIEKKPLYHFLPGSQIFSIASPGCNLKCAWCQNWDISQADDRNNPQRIRYTSPETLFKAVLGSKARSIAYTYTEPTVFFEYTLDVSRLAHENGIKNVYVSNGYMSEKMLDLYLPYLDAANIDLKAFDDGVYRRYAGAKLKPVLENCKRLKESGVWLEVTTLLVPGVNDDDRQLRGLAQFIAEDLGVETPWHLSRYFPQPQFDQIPPTPVPVVNRAMAIAREFGLTYVYAGNMSGGGDTHCPNCGENLVLRDRIFLQENRLREGCCPDCKTKIAGVW